MIQKVATKPIPYKRYGEILFQKVALCYLLHFVQDGSSKSALKSMFSTKVSKNQNSKKRSLNSAPGPPALPGVGGMGAALSIKNTNVTGRRRQPLSTTVEEKNSRCPRLWNKNKWGHRPRQSRERESRNNKTAEQINNKTHKI